MAKQTKTPDAQTETNPKLFCLCGCGKEVARRFLQGHDARLHSMVLRACRDEKPLKVSSDTAAYLKSAPWMDRKLAKFIKAA